MILIGQREKRLEELKSEKRHCDGGDTDLNFVPGLIDLVRFAKPKTVLEIGAHVGVSTETFALTCEHVTTVDPWVNDRYLPEFEARCRQYPNISVLRGLSPQALGFFEDGAFDLAYIDGEHDYDQVCADIRGCQRLVKKFGWIGGHDYQMSGVHQAVRTLLSAMPIVFKDTSWLTRAG